MAKATPSATTRPAAPPAITPWRDEANTMARVNTIVSSPSRPTAWKASSPRPQRARPSRAASVRRRSSAESLAGVVAHPERHVGERHRGHQVGDGLEDRLGARPGVGLDGEIGGDAARRPPGPGPPPRRRRRPGSARRWPSRSSDDEQDGHDHLRLDPLPQEDHERRDHDC